MMTNTAGITAIAASLVLAATFVGWRVHVTDNRPNVQIEIIKDVSKSTTDGCQALTGLAETALAADGISAKSSLAVLLVGDKTTANEPMLLATYAIPFSTKVMEDNHSNRRRQASLLADLLLKCQSVRPTGISPIFLAIKQAIADLRGRGCTAGSRCQLLVDSDLEENVEPAIKSRLDGIEARKSLPATLQNSGIAILFCGLAATTGQTASDPNRDDRLRAIWRSLFSAKDLITFRPYCPAPSLQSRAEPPRVQRRASLRDTR